MTTPQAALLGFPNPILGLVSYTIVITTGVIALTGAVLSRWYCAFLTAGALLGEVLVHWLIFQSLYRIGALCPYCIISWAVTLPILIIAADNTLTSGHPSTVVQLLHQ